MLVSFQMPDNAARKVGPPALQLQQPCGNRYLEFDGVGGIDIWIWQPLTRQKADMLCWQVFLTSHFVLSLASGMKVMQSLACNSDTATS
mmetsp:Transcript_47119/g.102513  ORF Transcript_47119/g.102513 Transcript_47119/m.102513 type:complete len:89 (-) Transcript_47119:316-582(-)